MKMRMCSGPCGCEYPENVFFRKNKVGQMHLPRAICVGCETTARTEEKCRDRTGAKARDTIRRHARKYGMSSDEFAHKFGWKVAQIKHDIEHAMKNGCAYCHRLFATMAHGLGDLTFDIVDPKRDPYYVTNVKIACQTCNREKSKTPPDIWAPKLLCWERWERRKEEQQYNPLVGLPLFEVASVRSFI